MDQSLTTATQMKEGHFIDSSQFQKSEISTLEDGNVQQAEARLPDFTTAEELALDKAVVRKLDFTVLPLICIAYLLSFLDRGNIGNAKVAGLAKDLHLSSHQYLVVVTSTYVLYIVAELPVVLLLNKMGPARVLTAMIASWGLVCCLTGIVQSYGGLVACRLVLGMAEGGLFPALVLILSCFYRRAELQKRVTFFYSMASLAGAFSGLLAAAIIKMEGVAGLRGWRWIFILEGIFTVCFSVCVFFLMPNSADTARVLSEEERAHVRRRLALDMLAGSSTEVEAFRFSEIVAAFFSIHTLIFIPMLFGAGVLLFGLAYFTPSIVADFHESVIRTQLLTVPPYAASFVFSMIVAFFSDRYQARGISTIVAASTALIGYIMFYCSERRPVRYAALTFQIMGAYCIAPCVVTWVPNNSAGHYRRATAIALAFSLTNCGGIAATWLFPSTDAPRYHTATVVGMTFACIIIITAIANFFYFKWANKQKAIKRDAMAVGQYTSPSFFEIGDKHPNFVYST